MATAEHKSNLGYVFSYLSGIPHPVSPGQVLGYQSIETYLLEKLSSAYHSGLRREYYEFFVEILIILYNNIGAYNKRLQGMLLSHIPSGGPPSTDPENMEWFMVVFNKILSLFNNFNNLLLLQQKVSGNFKIPDTLHNPSTYQYNALRIFFNVYGGQNYAVFSSTANCLNIIILDNSTFKISLNQYTRPRIDFNYLRNLILQSNGKDVLINIQLRWGGKGSGHANLLVISTSQKMMYVIEPNSSARYPFPYGPNLLPFMCKTMEDGLGAAFLQTLGIQPMPTYMQGVDISNTMGRHNYSCAVICMVNYLGHKGVFANRFAATGANQLDVVGSILKEFCSGFLVPTVKDITTRYINLFNGPESSSAQEMQYLNQQEYDFVFKQILETIPQHVPNSHLVTPDPEIIEEPELNVLNLDSAVVSTILENSSTYIPVPTSLFQNQAPLPAVAPITGLTSEELGFFSFGKTKLKQINREIKYLKKLC